MMKVSSEDENAAQIIWDALQRNEPICVDGKMVKGLFYCRHHDESFMAGYEYSNGHIVGVYLPESELKKIVPDIPIYWNSYEAGHSPAPLFTKKCFAEEEMNAIDEAFRNAGFRMEIDL